MTSEHVMTFEGKRYLVHKNTIPPDEGHDEGSVEYSMDGTKTWHGTMIEAYRRASADDTLSMILDTDVDEPGNEDFQSFVLALLHELQGLKPGESLRILRDTESMIVTKENAVLAIKASTIGDVDLRMEDSSGKHDG